MARPADFTNDGPIAKERELKATLGDLQAQLRSTSNSLNDFKQRATEAEVSSPSDGTLMRY